MDYLAFMIKELKLDIDEVDVDGKSVIIHAYEDYRKDSMAYLVA